MSSQDKGSGPTSATDESPSTNPSNVHDISSGARLVLPYFPETSTPESIDDKAALTADTARMTDITRDELRSTLSDIENRMDRRIDRMESTEDKRSESYRREQEARDTLYSERFEAMHKRLEDRDLVIDSKLDAMQNSVTLMTRSIDGFEKRLDEKLSDVKSSNRNALWATLAIAAATVVGIWGVNSTIIGSVSSFFDAGKSSMTHQQDAEKLLSDAKSQSETTYKLLLQIQNQIQQNRDPSNPVRH